MHLLHSPLLAVLSVIGYYLLSAAAGAMLPPESGKERTRYGYLFRFVQLLAANGHRLEQRLPGLVTDIAASSSRSVPMPLRVRVLHHLANLLIFLAGAVAFIVAFANNSLLRAVVPTLLVLSLAWASRKLSIRFYVDYLSKQGIL